MKRFLLFLVLAIFALPCTSLAFVVLNNVVLIPWQVTHLIWYGFPPLYALIVGGLYGAFYLRKGGAVFIAALLFAAAIIAVKRHGLPFADDLTEPPLLIVSAVFTLIGEIWGSATRTNHIKKRSAKHAPLQTE